MAATDPSPHQVPLPRWIAPLLLLAAAGLGPWTLWLTYSLPARHVTRHWDLAWIVFDVALLGAFAGTGWFAVRASQWLVPSAAATGTMLLCDAWFDIITASGRGERLEAILQAGFAELPLAGICAFVVYDAERFRQETIVRYSDSLRRRRRRDDD